jgi:hypothetical protein
MSFLYPSLLWPLLPLLGLPLLIHLLNKRFPERFLFSNVEHLRKTAAERSSLHRWRHRILTVVRTLFLLLLLLVFLQPVLDRFRNPAGENNHRRVLLVVDHSLSMEYRQNGTTTRQRAIIEAGKILGTLGAEDEVNVVAAGTVAETCFTDFSHNLAEARRYLQTLPPGVTRADFNQAAITAGRLLAKHPLPTEVYFLSDFQRQNWAQVDFQPLGKSARVFFTNVAPENPSNHAILGVELHEGQMLTGELVPLEVTVGNYSDETLTAPITARLDQQIEVQQALSVGPWSTAKVTLAVPATSPGLHLCELMLPPDALAADDHWVLALPVMNKEEIITLSESGDATKEPVPFLHAALNPFPNEAGALLPRHLASASLNPTQLAAAKKVFITRCGALDGARAETLAKFLYRGGGVVWFLDSKTDEANLRLLQTAMGNAKFPIQLGPLREMENVGSGAQQIASGDFNSRLLRLFRGPLRQDLGLLEFYDFHTASSTGNGKVLLSFADETPAMASVDYGLGTLVLLNFSVSEFSSNLARQRIFPAWMQELVKQLDPAEPPPLAFTAGQLVEGEVWRDDLRRQPITSPSAKVIDVRQEPLGERTTISFVPNELGLYTLVDGRLKNAFAVNPDPAEADLRPVDTSHLSAQVAAGQSADFLHSEHDYEEVAHGRPLLQWFLLAGLALLALELALQLTFRRLAR